nr:PREDICTED: 39S ribosomal protein L37, mitochondrial [Megachile rotundata]
MKFTQVLYKIHIGKAVRYLWQHQRERRVMPTKAESILTRMGLQVKDAKDIVAEPKCYPIFEFEEGTDLNTVNTTQTDLGDQSCLTYEDHNVLQAGVPQACLLTNTVQLDNKLPEKIEELFTDIPDDVNKLLRRIVYTSTIYDPQQVKLPIVKDPERPAWVFPRTYGITSTRKMHNLTKRFLQLCEMLSGLNIAQHRAVVHDGICCVGIDKEDDFIQFSLKMDMMMTSTRSLSPIMNVNTNNEFDMPNIYPLHHCISLTKANVRKSDMYPINMKTPIVNDIHTIFINYDPEEVKNLTELPVTENQIYARSMMKSFTAAAGCARQKFGENVKELPEPVVVQCIQSDGQNFQFSVYQLNTLDMDSKNIRNYWWAEPFIKLYESAQYDEGKPCVQEYNKEVFKRFLAFYRNQ